MDAAQNLVASVNGALLLTLACLSFFGALLAWHCARAQRLAVFLGLLAAQSLMSLYFFTSAFAVLFAPSWLLAFMGSVLTRLLFFMLFAALWLAFPLFNPHLSSANEKAPRVWPWLLALFIALLLLTSAGLAESYALANAPLAASTHELLRQIFAGSASGFLLIAAGFLAYRCVRLRQALYAWLLCAALTLLFSVALQSFQPLSSVLITTVLVLAQVLTVLALLADRARFLRTESEARRGLWENLTQLENTSRHLASALTHMSAGVAHVDLEGKIIFANPSFAPMARANVEQLEGQTLKEILPQPVYQMLAPALQEARRERTATMETRCVLQQQEFFFNITHAPLLNEHGKLKALHLGLTDATRTHTESRALTASLAERESALGLLQHGLDHAFDAFALTNAQHEILYANEAFARSLGLPRSELQRRLITDFRTAEFYPWPEMQKRISQNLAWRGEVSGRGKEGRRFSHEITVIPIAENGNQNYFWIERDLAALEGRINTTTAALEQRVQQMTRLLKIGEDIRLHASLATIIQSVADAVHTLGWRRVAVFLGEEEEAFDLIASAGFSSENKNLPRKFRRLAYADFAPYLSAAFRLSSSFLIKAASRGNARLEFMPKELDVVSVGEWNERDCLLVPIRSRERLAGLLAVFSPDSGRYPETQHVRDLESYSDEAAIAIQNHELMASHAERERQARALNQIGNAFRAAGTMERVLAECATIMAEALHEPALLAVRMHETMASDEVFSSTIKNEWLGAWGELARKRQVQSHSLSFDEEAKKVLQNLFARLGESEMQEVLLAPEELSRLVPIKMNGAEKITLKVYALRSRAEVFGLAFWLGEEEEKPRAKAQTQFRGELIAQATLTLDNTRLFFETEEKARALLRANNHTSEFLASVSHELRTPLHGILQFSEILLRGKLEDKQKEHVRIVQSSGKNLLALINDILDLSKIEAGKMEAVLAPLDLPTLLRETLAPIQPLCEQKGLNLKRVFESSLPDEIVTDRLLLGRVLTNLLGNAVKFTERGEIVCRAHKRTASLQIEVQDTGTGMPKQRLQEIFEPFRQLESGEARKHGGTGLGLAISQRLMRILGGNIEVASELGKGSTFTVTLPLDARPSMTAREHKPAATEMIATKAPVKKSAKRNALILVIDDDANARLAMRFILEDEGYRVLFAESGEDALPQAQREQPDLILMDIMMPKLDGYQVARALKSQKQLKHVPLIASTARAMKGDREKAFAAGCDDYLTKPFESAEIVAMMKKWLG